MGTLGALLRLAGVVVLAGRVRLAMVALAALVLVALVLVGGLVLVVLGPGIAGLGVRGPLGGAVLLDRKSTRLNSSHSS